MSPMRSAVVQKLAFVALNAGLLAVFALGVAAPIWGGLEERIVALGERRALLARTQLIEGAEGQAKQYAQQVRSRNARGGLIEGGNEGAASAAMQALLKSAAEAQGGVVRSLGALPSRAVVPGQAMGQVPGQMIGARLEYAGTLAAITRTIHAIESGPVMLVVTAASLRPRREAARERAEEPQVDAQLDVYGGFKEARP